MLTVFTAHVPPSFNIKTNDHSKSKPTIFLEIPLILMQGIKSLNKSCTLRGDRNSHKKASSTSL